MVYYNYFNGLYIRDVNAHLARGDEVHAICYSLPDEAKRVLGGRLTVHRIMERGYNERLPLEYLVKIIYFFSVAFIKISTLHFKKRFDLIHVVSPPDFMLFAAIIPKVLGARVILNIHDIVPEFYMRKFGVKEDHIIIRILRIVEKICCHLSDHVLTVTDIWRNKLVRRTGISESKCSVLMNVPDDKLVKLAKNKKKALNSHFKLLYPGNLGEHFGVETLIRAMPIVKREIPSVRLYIYGTGAGREYLAGLAKTLDVDDVIQFNCYIPLEQVVDVMRQVDVGIVPTLGGVFAGEALSTKSLEFIGVGTPIVISRTAASEYYYNDSMVMFFKQGDHSDLANRIIELYKNPERREAQVRNAKAFNEKHNWENYKKIYYETVDKLVECSKKCQ